MKPGIICLTEPWFKHKSIPLDGYICADYSSRQDKKGGGAAIYVQSNMMYTVLNKLNSLTVESAIEISAISIKKIGNQCLKTPLHVISIYRPPTEIKEFVEIFFEKLESILVTLHQTNAMFMLSGDFNIDIFTPTSNKTKQFLNLCKSFNLAPLFTETPSRIHKQSVTLIDNCLTNLPVSTKQTWDPGLSDHKGQLTQVKLNKNGDHFNTNVKRIWSAINMMALRVKLFDFFANSSELFGDISESLSDLFNLFTTNVYSFMDVCCPLKVSKNLNKQKTRLNKKLLDLSEEKKTFLPSLQNDWTKKIQICQ